MRLGPETRSAAVGSDTDFEKAWESSTADAAFPYRRGNQSVLDRHDQQGEERRCKEQLKLSSSTRVALFTLPHFVSLQLSKYTSHTNREYRKMRTRIETIK